MFCPKCGSKNADGAAFCGSCGERLNAAGAAKKNAAPVVTTTATGGVTTGDGATAAAAKKTGRLVGIAFAVVLVVAAVIAFLATNGFGLMGPSIPVKDTVNDYTWEELSQISAEIAKASDEDAAVETAKRFNLTTEDGKLNGTQVKDVQLSDGMSAQVQIAGFAHDDRTDGGKAGITFIFKDAIAEHAMNSYYTNAGGWEASQMRSWLASDVMAILPDDLKGSIVSVDKLTNNAGETESASSVTATSDKLWLYSSTELWGNIEWCSSSYYNEILNAEGSEYKLFRDMDVDSDGSNGILVKMIDGTSCYWWERSPYLNYSSAFYVVNIDGYPNDGDHAAIGHGVVPGFCI